MGYEQLLALNSSDSWVTSVAILAFLTPASYHVGYLVTKIQRGRFSLPKISGYLLTGVVIGPHCLKILSHKANSELWFVSDLCLAVIALAAGAEVKYDELRKSVGGLASILTLLVLTTFLLSFFAILVTTYFLTLSQEFDSYERIALAAIGATILVARSPASAIAILQELDASGPFCTTVLSVTVLADVIIILMFAVNLESAKAIFGGEAFDMLSVLHALFHILASVAMGVMAGAFFAYLLTCRIAVAFKSVTILGLSGFMYLTLALAAEEPVLACVAAGVIAANRREQDRTVLLGILENAMPIVNVVFFMLAGCTLEVGKLMETMWAAVTLFMIRLGANYLGATAGASIGGLPKEQHNISWMAYVTQAGVSLGLTNEMATAFPTWGPSFASLLISVIVLNQLVGPALFKEAIVRVGEAGRGSTATARNRERLAGLKSEEDRVDNHAEAP